MERQGKPGPDLVVIRAPAHHMNPVHWTPEHIYPDLAPAFASLRTGLGRRPQPRLVLLTSGGEITVSHPAVVGGATIVTTSSGASALKDRLPASCDVIEIGKTGLVDLRRAVDELRDRGHEVILTEGGPHVLGELMKQDLLDEAFLTISPVVAGRDGDPRLGMVAGAEFLPAQGVWTRLLSTRRHPHPDRPLPPGFSELGGVGDLDRLLPESDFVVICCQWTPETTRLFDKDRFAAMKAGGVLINVARGEIVDEEALADALQRDHLRGAALDVYVGEFEHTPMSRLWSDPRVLITPHISSASDQDRHGAINLFCDNLRAYLEGGPLRNVIDWERGY